MRTAARIARGQRVEEAKVDRARELRRDLTSAENLLPQALRRGQLNGLHFRRQQVIHGFIVDFYCPERRLIVEVDGPVHDQQPGRDEERDEILSSQGCTVLHLTNAEVEQNLAAALQRIAAAAQLSPLPLSHVADTAGVTTSLCPTPCLAMGEGVQGFRGAKPRGG